MTKYKVEPILRHLLDEILRDYVCSTCWSNLSFKHVEKKWYAICPNCNEETAGYVSKKFAERRKEESEQEFIEASRNLRDVFEPNRERHSIEENLKAIGF